MGQQDFSDNNQPGNDRPGGLGSSDNMPGSELRARRVRLLAIREIFCFRMSPHLISLENLVTLEEEVRTMLSSLDELRDDPLTNEYLLEPFQALFADLVQIVKCFNLAIDIKAMRKTLKRQDALYELYISISDLIYSACQKIIIEY